MTAHALVCDFDEKLISHLENQNIVIRVKDPKLVYHAVETLRERNRPLLVWLHGDFLLSDLNILELENAISIPIVVQIPCLADFRKWIVQVSLLRRCHISVFLSESAPENYRNLRILSSLGVTCGITFENSCPDWNLLSDLMYYAVYSIVPHAPVQPFHYVISFYDPMKDVDLGHVYFDDPRSFLHVDAAGHVAMSRRDLEDGKFISNTCGALNEIGNMPLYIKRLEEWRDFFLKSDGCAYCPAWHICQGKFEQFGGEKSGCQAFFTELLEAAEFYQEQKKKHSAMRQSYSHYPL